MDNLQKGMEFCLLEYRDKVEKQYAAGLIDKYKQLAVAVNSDMSHKMDDEFKRGYKKAIEDAIKLLTPGSIDLDEARVNAAVQMGFLVR